MAELILERTLLFEADLKRNFRPFEVVEGNFQYVLVSEVDGRQRLVNRRQRKVRYISHDQNRIQETIEDRGPATSEGQFVMPCAGAVEMAEAWDMIDAMKEKQAALAARSALVKPLRDKAFRQFIADQFEEEGRQAKHSTTVGPLVRVQRS